MAPGNASRRFNSRAFVSLTMALAGAGLPVTGLANHLLQMEPMSVARHAWMSAHNSLGVVFVAFALWHVVLNRRVFGTYFRAALSRVPSAGREIAWALAVVTITTGMMVFHAFHLR